MNKGLTFKEAILTIIFGGLMYVFIAGLMGAY